MQQQQHAAVEPREVDRGVAGLRPRARSYSSESSSAPAAAKKEASDNSVLTRWGSENPEELARKIKLWQALRQRQKDAMEAKAGPIDVVKLAAVAILITRVTRALGVSTVRSVAALAALALGKALWDARAPTKVTKQDPRLPFRNWPIFGEIGVIPQALKMSLPLNQVWMVKKRDFETSELVMFGGTRDINVMDPEDREYVLRTNWKNFTKNAPDVVGFQEMFAEIMGQGIFAVDGELWQDHRKVAAHLFSANGLRSKMERSFTEHGAKLAELLSTIADSGRVLDWQDVMAGLTFETICGIAFGMDPNALEPGFRGVKIDFLKQFDRLQQLCTLRFLIPAPIWKTLRWLNIGSERIIREDAEAISAYVKKIISERRASGAWATQDDLLSMYIQTARASGKEYIETDDYLQDAILNFMVAGRDTTSITLTNIFKLLATDRNVEAKMIEELERVVGRNNSVQWDHVRSLPYCGAVFNEVLRLYPPVAGDMRICNVDDVLPSGQVVPAKSRVSIANAAIGRDYHLWKDPDFFKPERWLGEDPTQPTRRVDEYIHPVFWGGPRLCLGKDMARLEALSISWAVLQRFKIDVLPHDERKVNGPVQFYDAGLPVRVLKRE